jgi:hypothetical protein
MLRASNVSANKHTAVNWDNFLVTYREKCLAYHEEINEQNSAENWSAVADGGGWSTIASSSS